MEILKYFFEKKWLFDYYDEIKEFIEYFDDYKFAVFLTNFTHLVISEKFGKLKGGEKLVENENKEELKENNYLSMVVISKTIFNIIFIIINSKAPLNFKRINHLQA